MSASKTAVLIFVASLAQAQTGLMCSPMCQPSTNIKYVDSAAGVDANPGICAAGLVRRSSSGTPSWSGCAWATLAKVQATLASQQATVFTRGSYFRESGIQPSVAVNHELVFAGIGDPSLAKPMIDLSLPISSGAWTDQGSGCYSATIAPASSGPGNAQAYVNMWETISGVTQTMTPKALAATSPTSYTIGTGSFTFTIPALTAVNYSYTVGTILKVSSRANPSNFGQGTVAVATTTSPTLQMTITSVGGSGTFTDWNIFPPTPIACQSNLGSYYSDVPLGQMGTQTVYVHPLNGTDPRTDGHTYEYSANFSALDLSVFSTTAMKNSQIWNIAAMKNSRNDGAMLLSHGGYGYGLDLSFGGKHSILTQDGVTLEHITMTACGTLLGGIPLIQFDDSTNHYINNFTDVTFDGTGSQGVSCNPYYSHLNGGVGFGTTTLTNWTVANNVGAGFAAEHDFTLLNTTCGAGVAVCVSGITSINIDNLTSHASKDLNLIQLIPPTKVYVVTNSHLLGGNTNTVSGDITFRLQNSVLASTSAFAIAGLVVMTADHNSYYTNPYRNTDSTLVINSSDFNTFCYIGGNWANYHNVAYTQLPWQALGFDQNSFASGSCP